MRSQVIVVIMLCVCWVASASELRFGIVGTDSSHAVEFTRILNGMDEPDHVAGARVVVAYRGGSPSFALSRDRIAGFTATLTNQWRIPFVNSIGELCSRVDGLLLLSVDPGTRQREFTEAATCGKPIFVDKPFADTLPTAVAMASFASQHNVRWFSASALRYSVAQQTGPSDVSGADVWGPGALGDARSLDLSWYGIHSIEMLYALLGPGVRTVARVHRTASDVITAVWADGRIGTVHLGRPDLAFGRVVFHATGRAEVRTDVPIGYDSLLRHVVQFVQTGVSPVVPHETLEIFALMDAAERSMRANGTPFRLAVIR